MKILKFHEINEVILNPHNSVIDFLKELEPGIDLNQFKKIASKHDILVQKFNSFYKSLNPSLKKGAEPLKRLKMSKLLVTGTIHPMKDDLVIIINDVPDTYTLDADDIKALKIVMPHEGVHKSQYLASGGKAKDSHDVSDYISYLSNKQEIMAHSRDHAEYLFKTYKKSLLNDHKTFSKLVRGILPLNSFSTDVKNRYLKYIYLYYKDICSEN